MKRKKRGERPARAIREIYAGLLALPAAPQQLSEAGPLAAAAQEAADRRGETLSQYELMSIELLRRAQEGDIRAAAFVRDSYGDAPVQKTRVSTETLTAADAEIAKRVAERLGVAPVKK